MKRELIVLGIGYLEIIIATLLSKIDFKGEIILLFGVYNLLLLVIFYIVGYEG